MSDRDTSEGSNPATANADNEDTQPTNIATPVLATGTLPQPGPKEKKPGAVPDEPADDTLIA